MSRSTGTAIGGSNEILSLMINGKEALGAAYGGQKFFTKGAELYSVVSVGPAVTNSPAKFTISCNRATNYVVTYTVSSSGALSGVTRSNVACVDTSNGRREISFTVTFGTIGKRTLRIYGATSSNNATNHLSVNYIDVSINVSSATASSFDGDAVTNDAAADKWLGQEFSDDISNNAAEKPINSDTYANYDVKDTEIESVAPSHDDTLAISKRDCIYGVDNASSDVDIIKNPDVQ